MYIYTRTYQTIGHIHRHKNVFLHLFMFVCMYVCLFGKSELCMFVFSLLDTDYCSSCRYIQFTYICTYIHTYIHTYMLQCLICGKLIKNVIHLYIHSMHYIATAQSRRGASTKCP